MPFNYTLINYLMYSVAQRLPGGPREATLKASSEGLVICIWYDTGFVNSAMFGGKRLCRVATLPGTDILKAHQLNSNKIKKKKQIFDST